MKRYVYAYTCADCGRAWDGRLGVKQCDECRSAGGRPVACFSCGSAMRWIPGREAECFGCDARYPLAAIRTYRLGMLVERLAVETASPDEVGRLILAVGRKLRRVV